MKERRVIWGSMPGKFYILGPTRYGHEQYA